MSTIKPFRPIQPNPRYADQLVFIRARPAFVSGDVTREGGLKALLETRARLRPETPQGQEMAYRDIKETLQDLLERDQLRKDKTNGMYVYETVHQNYRQTGIWVLTDLDDYANGTIKTHELTIAESVRRMKNYRENTGLEGSPLLLTYPTDGTINAIIAIAKANQPKTILGNGHELHRLWKIGESALQEKLLTAFAGIAPVYLSDGHHRLESAALLAKEQREKGLPVYNDISSLYMATDQLRIEAYNRVVIPEEPIDKMKLFHQLSEHFHRKESTGNHPVQPRVPHGMGLYLDGRWYELLAKAHTYEHKTPVERIGAAILQEHVLSKIFGIHDPKTDSRLRYAGGEKALEEIGALFLAHPQAVAFTLCPLMVNELIAVADAGDILPPKSTWIVPKVPYGLLIHQY
jgi:uncharacterized protein (DUF1015 family)